VLQEAGVVQAIVSPQGASRVVLSSTP
jgi:hypothetical protein